MQRSWGNPVFVGDNKGHSPTKSLPNARPSEAVLDGTSGLRMMDVDVQSVDSDDAVGQLVTSTFTA